MLFVHCVIQASKVEKKRAEAKASSGWFGWFASSVVEEEKDVIPSGDVYLCVYVYVYVSVCVV